MANTTPSGNNWGAYIKMTVAIGIAVPEGILIAGDSRTTYGNSRGWPKIASDYTEKVYQITEKVGAATFGWAFLNQKNIRSLIEEFKDSLAPGATIEEVLIPFVDFFESQYEQHIQADYDKPVQEGTTAFGFIVGGYDKDKVGRMYVCHIPGKIIHDKSTTSSPGATWQGQIDIISRLIKGCDPRLNRSNLPEELKKDLDAGEYIIYFNRMNLQDAIDFAIFAVRTTIEMQRFSDGIFAVPGDLAGVGGFIDVCLITGKEFRWVQKKELRGEVPSWVQYVR